MKRVGVSIAENNSTLFSAKFEEAVEGLVLADNLC